MPAREALKRLRDGNARFAENMSGTGTLVMPARRAKLTAGQEPFAIVLGCSDSRVPVELVFNQGPGDLFVIRVAGNIVAPSLIGSIEFAADRFGTRLVVVLGHSSCGAMISLFDEKKGIAAPHFRAWLRFTEDGLATTLELERNQGAN